METIKTVSGIELALTQEPYLTASGYEAAAVDADGNEFLVAWNAYYNADELRSSGDDSDCCDWTKFTATEI